MKIKSYLKFYTIVGAVLQVVPVFFSHTSVYRFFIMYNQQGRPIPFSFIVLEKIVLLSYLIPALLLFLAIRGIIHKKSDSYFIHILGVEALFPVSFLIFAVSCMIAIFMNMGLMSL